MGYKDNSKQWFETGDKPTQAQFYTTFDNLRWKDELIPIAEVTGLVNALLAKVNASDYEGQLVPCDAPFIFTIPAGYKLEEIIPFYGAAGTMQAGFGAYGSIDLLNEDEIVAGWNQPLQTNYFAPVNTDLYIDGIPAGSKLVFLKRKIKMV